MNMSEEYEDEVDRVAHQALVERHLRRYNNFMEKHSVRLIGTLEKCFKYPQNLGESVLEDNEAEKQRWNGAKGAKIDVNSSASIINTYGFTHHIWDYPSDPIQISPEPVDLMYTNGFEYLIMSAEVPSGCNPDVAKVMLVLVTIADQLKSLTDKGWSSIVEKLILYGEGIDEDRLSMHLTEGKGHLVFSQFLSCLYNLEDFIDKCSCLLSHTILQLTSIFKDNKPQVVSSQGLHLPSVLLEIAYLLGLLAVFDEVISNQTLLQEHWAKYKRMIRSVRADSASFGVDPPNLVKLEMDLEKLDKQIMSGRIFQTTTENVLVEVRHNGGKTSGCFAEKITIAITNWCGGLERDFLEGQDELKPIAVAAFFGFMSVLVPNFDAKKLFPKVVWDTLRKIPAVHIGGGFLWMPEKFFSSMDRLWALKAPDTKARQAVNSSRFAYLDAKVSSLGKDVLQYHVQVAQWCTKLQETFYLKDSSQLTREDLTKRCNLLLKGVKMTATMSQSFRIVINLHATLGKPVNKHVVANLCRLLELIKTVQCTVHRFNTHIAESTSTILQNVTYIALSQVISLKNYFLTLRDPKRTDDTRMDTLAVLGILEHVLRGSPSKTRIAIARLAVEWINASARLWREEDDNGILAAAIDRVHQMLEMKRRMERVFDTSFVYWHRIILSSYFGSAYDSKDTSKIRMMFMVLNDCNQKIRRSSPHGDMASINFEEEVKSCFQTNLVEKLCREVEMHLRLASHTHLRPSNQLSSNENTSCQQDLTDFRSILDIPSVQFNDTKINLKFMVELYLSKTFYNYASVALHDWYSYAKMRVIACNKYNLKIQHDHLPGHSLEQGLDVLDIAKNLSRFVQEFSYNLNNQVFVQVTSFSKHVDTVNIRHMANSLRTHGSGITSTIINTVYLFLHAKIRNFSQFLFDEQIKSRLAKEIRIFKQLNSSSSQAVREYGEDSISSGSALSTLKTQTSFSYDRVLKFQRGIRKLGVSPEGYSQLDHFRILITHIGNALGFVRLVRSGGLNFLATECRFVNKKSKLREEGQVPGDPLQVGVSAKNLSATLDSLSTAVSDSVDYLKLLVQGFTDACRDAKNLHLRLFYAIVPALTLSYVDHIRSCKEKLVKKTSPSHALFTDDGFAMGVAYLLKVLSQDHEFDSLQWFTSVNTRLEEEKSIAEKSVQAAKKDEKLQQASTLTVKRIQDSLNEFQLLWYNFSSARIFFQQNVNDTESK